MLNTTTDKSMPVLGAIGAVNLHALFGVALARTTHACNDESTEK
jgi:hypothetical protein